MGRKSNTKDHLCLPDETNNNDTNDLYRKRLRSWNQTSTQLKSNHTIDDEVTPLHRSTIYTYPINLNHDRQSRLSNTILSETLTTESAFYCPSISCNSIQTIGDINNNHVTASNFENTKRKNNSSSSSCESLSIECSQIKTQEILTNSNDEKNISTNRLPSNNLQLTYYQNPTKRSRLTTDDSIITNHRSLNPPILIDDDTIDINQLDPQEPLLSSLNNESLINNSNSMEAAVKMVQPIVDIIFNAFEDQLKHVQTKTIQPSLSNISSVSPQIYSPMMVPHFSSTSPARPIVLHAVNFNIQLTAKRPTINSLTTQNSNTSHLPNVRLAEHDHLQLTSLTELKEKVVSYVLSNNFITDHQTTDDHRGNSHKLTRIVQLAVVGVSVLCGYFLL